MEKKNEKVSHSLGDAFGECLLLIGALLVWNFMKWEKGRTWTS